MKKEFIVNRQGKDFCLYEGLLDEAHQKGLIRISTAIVQLPTEANGREAVCTAEVEMPPNAESNSQNRIFCGVGDASPANVGRLIVPHVLRMAETRAKARALRDAVNVGTAAVEELGDGDEQPDVPKSAPAAAATPKTNTAKAGSSNGAHAAAKANGNSLQAVCEQLAKVRGKGESWMAVANIIGNMLGIQIRIQRNDVAGLTDKERENMIGTTLTQIEQLRHNAEPGPVEAGSEAGEEVSV